MDDVDRRLREYSRLTRAWMQSREGQAEMAARASQARRKPDMSPSAIDARLREQARASILSVSLARTVQR